jgi:SOS-response transcriptional repressor LexA
VPQPTNAHEKSVCPEGPQKLCLQVVRDYLRENGVSPGYDEVAAGMQRGRTPARRAVAHLLTKGFLTRGPGRFRNLIVTNRGHRALKTQKAA